MTIPPRQDWWQDLDATPFTWHIPDEFNIARACLDGQNPADVALIVDAGDGLWHQYTFGDVASLSRKFATVLTELDITVGDRIGVMVPQGIDLLTAHLGAFQAGIVTVPLSVKFGPDAVAHRLHDSGARLLVIDAERYSHVRDGLTDIESLEAVLLVGDNPAEATPITVQPFQQLIAAAAESEQIARTGPDSHAIIIYTSGTTGHPKGALHGHKILPAHMPGVRTAFDNAPQPRDVFWTPADWAWIGGLFDVLFPALAMGCPVVAAHDKFTPARALEVMRRHKVTAAFIPPTALKQLRSTGIDRAATQGVHLRTLATGGESLGDALQTWVADTFGVMINEFYGQTEMNLTVGTARATWRPEPGSMGRAFPGFTVAILDPDGQPVQPGDTGEIGIAAGNPGQFLQYWNQPDKTQDKVHDGWIHTGDLGRADTDGNLWYQGRTDDVISSAGYRIGPGEIEECLLAHPAVALAGVIGVPDQLRGEAVHAFVVLADGTTASDELRDELQNHVKSRLAFYQYPRHITFLDDLPTTTTGKILRRELRAMAAEVTHDDT